MPFEVKLPDIGEGVAEGEIVRWMVKVGDAVKEDQPLVEVMTDKANVEIPSPRTGRVAALLADEGQVVPVGTAIIAIEVAGETPAASPAKTPALAGTAATPRAGRATVAGTGPSVARVQAAPAVRQLAKELGVALESVAGTGPGGAITAEDVRGAGAAGKHAPDATGVPAADAPAPGDEERVPLRGLRRKIAEHMRRSLDTAAHFTFVAECDMSGVVAHLESLAPRARDAGIKLTYLAYVVKAMVQPLRDYPMLNASLDDAAQEVVLKRSLHVGIATATEEGLTVPVVRNADRCTLFELAREIQRLALAARAGKLK